MKNFWNTNSKPMLVLAPMAGVTDQPFRLMCKKYGAEVLYSEMVSSEALYHNVISTESRKRRMEKSRDSSASVGMTANNKQLLKTLELIKFSKQERPFVVQIFGANPEHMAFAAKYIASGKWAKDLEKIRNSNIETRNKSKIKNTNDKNNNNFGFRASDFKFESIPDGIDINMGCPAKDVVKIGAGAALMKNPELAVKIVKAVKKEVKNIPVSVKTRLGWSKPDEILEFAKKIQNAGADAIAIHGRTYKQGFTGEADWEMICKVKKMLKIPVIGNGDLKGTVPMGTVPKLDGYMIGQGALGKPEVFKKLQENCHADTFENNIKEASDSDEILRFVQNDILEHAKLAEELKGKQGVVEFRKHFGWYIKNFPNAKEIRSQLNTINSVEDVQKLLESIDKTS